MGDSERDVRDRALDALAEIDRLDARPMFGGFGFYIDGLLVAAAWDGAFQLRFREDGHWNYRPVNDATLDDPALLVELVRARADTLPREPTARAGRSRPVRGG